MTYSTGETVPERAWPKAAALEAESRFWEDHAAGVWQRLADACFSPRFLHSSFVGKGQIIFPRFRALLREADVKIQPPAKWRDRTRPKGKPSGRRWQWRGTKRTLDDLLEHAAGGLSRAALRFRLDAGWDVNAALSTPPMSRSEAGLKGANIVNNPRRKRA